MDALDALRDAYIRDALSLEEFEESVAAELRGEYTGPYRTALGVDRWSAPQVDARGMGDADAVFLSSRGRIQRPVAVYGNDGEFLGYRTDPFL